MVAAKHGRVRRCAVHQRSCCVNTVLACARTLPDGSPFHYRRNLIGGRSHAFRSNSVRETRRIADTKSNHRFREIGVGILARADSRETTSRLSRLFLFRRGTPPQNRSDSRGDFGVPGTRSRNDIAAIRLLRPARSGGRDRTHYSFHARPTRFIPLPPACYSNSPRFRSDDLRRFSVGCFLAR